jgi:predicted transcriptional regulator
MHEDRLHLLDDHITITLSTPLKRALQRIARRRMTSVSSLIRDAILNYIAVVHTEFDGEYSQSIAEVEQEIQEERNNEAPV